MNKQIVKINLIYTLSFLSDALFSPFLALYFSSINMDENKKGILLSLIPLAAIFGSLIYGKLSGKAQRNLLIIRILVIAQLIPMMVIGFINNYIVILIFTIIFALHNNTFFSFQDGIGVKITNQENAKYANTRFFGSFGYLLGTFIGGKLIDVSNFGIVFLIAGIIFAIVELLLFFIKVDEETEIQKEKISLKQIFRHKEFIFYLIFYVFVLGSWNIGEAYISIMFKNDGVTTSEWGYIFALEIFVEMATIFIINRLIKKNMNYRLMLFVAICAMSSRSLILSLGINLWVKVFISAILRGFSWGMFLSSHMENVKKILPSSLITKAVLVLAICSNLFAFLGDFIAPNIYQKYTFNTLYLILFIFQLLGGIILLAFTLFKRRVTKKEN